MTWEYRVLHEEHEEGEHAYSIVEAYYREGTEEVELWSQPESTNPHGESIAELGADLTMMLDAILKKPLERKDLPGGH